MGKKLFISQISDKNLLHKLLIENDNFLNMITLGGLDNEGVILIIKVQITENATVQL